MRLTRGTPQVDMQVTILDGHLRNFGRFTQIGEMTGMQDLAEYQWSSFVMAGAEPSFMQKVTRTYIIDT